MRFDPSLGEMTSDANKMCGDHGTKVSVLPYEMMSTAL